MATIQVGLPASYPWILAIAAATPIVTLWQMFLVVKARKAAKIRYPQLYATKEEEAQSPLARKFNCAQRSHQNTLETLGQFFVTLFVGGLHAPRTTIVAGAVCLLGRVVYTLGYSTGDPKARYPGHFVWLLATLTLYGSAIYSSYALLSQTNFHF